MLVRKLYIVNDGTADIDMLLVSCLLNPMDYKAVAKMIEHCKRYMWNKEGP
jgi:hypothetical protein